METAVQLSTIITAIAAILALAVTVGIYYHGLRREIRLETIKAFSEIRNRYPNTKSLDDKLKLKYLNELEYFSIGINTGIYDAVIVKKMSGGRLIRQYDNWMKEFIRNRREMQSRLSGNKKTNAYVELEKMIKKIR